MKFEMHGRRIIGSIGDHFVQDRAQDAFFQRGLQRVGRFIGEITWIPWLRGTPERAGPFDVSGGVYRINSPSHVRYAGAVPTESAAGEAWR